MCLKWFVQFLGTIDILDKKILCCGAVLCTKRCLAAPLASTYQKPTAGDSGHTQNMQINEVTVENEICVFYRKNIMDFLANPILC